MRTCFFLFLTICCQNQDQSSSNAFKEAHITLYIFLFIQYYISISLTTAFGVNIIIDKFIQQIELH